jgi:hypothetical protein
LKTKSFKSISRTKASRADLVTVAKYGNSMEAQLARTKLQSRKIQSYVFDENMISMMPVYDLAWGGVRLAVKDSDLVQASKILGLKTRGNFWVPTKMFFFTYVFSEYLLGILIIPVGVLLYFISVLVFGPIDGNFLVCFNAIFFGAYSLAYSGKVAGSILTWVNKRSGPGNVKAGICKAIRCLGALAFCIGIILTYHNTYWFSAPIVFWLIFSLAAWKYFFDFISSAKFSAYVKKFIAWLRKLRY